MKRILTLLFATLLVLSAIAPAAAVTNAGPAAPSIQEGNETATNESTDSLEGDRDEPGIANSLRVSPVGFDEEFLETTTEERDEAFNTSGPFAAFTLSQPAENVRIGQSGAEATLLEGETVVFVEYSDDAANSSATYFELELFFEDGSSTTVDLHATETSVSVAAAKLEDYEPLINDMQDDAADRGYEATPDGLESYHEWQKDRVELVESFLVERAAQLLGLTIAAAENPLVWVLGLISIVVLTFRREQAHGWILDRIENDAGATARQQEQLESAYQRDQQTANEESITVLDEINDQQAVYWNDSFDVHSTLQMAELALRGPNDAEFGFDEQALADGGEVQSAISELEAEHIHDSWLAEAFSTNRLSGPREALSCIKACLVRMEATYGMGHRYSGVRSDVEELITELETLERGYQS